MYEKYLDEIDKRLKQVPIIPSRNKNNAAIFDLDECCLSSYHFHAAGTLNKYSSFEDVVSVFNTSDSPAIESVLSFYNKLLIHNYNIFIITGRPDIKSLEERTKGNLVRVGYGSYRNIFFLHESCPYSMVAYFKKATRDMLSAQGYNIIYNVGDQQSDFLGSSATYNIRLPNPLY